MADRVKISNIPKGHQNGRNKDTILAAHLHTHATTKSAASTLSKTNSLERRIPLCHKHVLTSPNKEQWLDAEQKEMAGLWEVGAWIWAKCPDDIRPIMLKWTYALKTNAEGEIQRFKARICARGDQTKEGIDYEETFHQ